MDPKLSSLDPKLQDAYNRVMGSSPTGNTPPTPQPSTLNTPDPALAPPISSSPDPVAPQFPNPPSDPPPTMIDGTQNAAPPAFNSPDPASPPPFPTDPAISPTPDPISPPPMVETAPPPAPAIEPSPTPAPTMPEVQSEPTPVPDPAISPSTTEQTVATSSMPSNAIPGVTTTVAFNASNSDKNVGTTPVKKGGLHLMPVIVGIGIVFLLTAYTFVWIILFNVQVPFLPQL